MTRNSPLTVAGAAADSRSVTSHRIPNFIPLRNRRAHGMGRVRHLSISRRMTAARSGNGCCESATLKQLRLHPTENGGAQGSRPDGRDYLSLSPRNRKVPLGFEPPYSITLGLPARTKETQRRAHRILKQAPVPALKRIADVKKLSGTSNPWCCAPADGSSCICRKAAPTYCVPAQNHQLDIGVVGSWGPFGLELRGNPVRPFRANPGLPPQL
jgi:hypothetical protein